MALRQHDIEKGHYTEEEYLRWEDGAQTKPEYLQGEIRAMSGGTDNQAAIAFNLSVALGVTLSRADIYDGIEFDLEEA